MGRKKQEATPQVSPITNVTEPQRQIQDFLDALSDSERDRMMRLSEMLQSHVPTSCKCSVCWYIRHNPIVEESTVKLTDQGNAVS